jgi:S1-C subfamily serine protease
MSEHPASAAPPDRTSAELDPAAAPAEPLIRPGPGLRLLSAVVLAILVGGLIGGAAAWAIYQHYGPVERIVYQQITGSSGSQAQTVGQLAQANAASVVTIATQPVTPGDLAAGTASLVDGVIVSGKGLILTSAHAVQNASQLRVGLADGRGYDAVIAEIDLTHGLAMLRITTPTGVTPTGLTPISFAASPPSIGDEAIALSRTASGGLSVGVGDVSAVGLTVTTDTSSTTDQSVQGAISIDATPEPDADGAPVLDGGGNLIGIVTTITQAPAPAGLTALSLSAASALLTSVSGGATQGSFGVEATYIDPATAAAADLTPGALIEAVDPGGPAAGIDGLQVGDIVTSVNGISINATHPFDPAGLGLGPGDIAELTVVRGTSTRTIALTVGTPSSVATPAAAGTSG